MNTLRMLREAGFTTRGLCWDRRRDRVPQEYLQGVLVRNSHVPGSYSTKALFFYVPLWWIYVSMFLLFHSADCYYTVDMDSAAPALAISWIRRLCRRPVHLIFDIADFYTAKAVALPRFLYKPLDALERFIAAHADAVVIPDAARIYLLGATVPKRLFVLPNAPYDCVDSKWRKPVHRKEFIVFCAGTLSKDRGIHKLLDVTREMADVRVVLAGRLFPPIDRALFDGAPHVEYLGIISQDEVFRRTFEADAVYSYYDPVLEINRTANSTKLYEAMTCGTPVVCNSEPPSTWVVVETGCGVCLPYNDDEGLRRTILEWRDNRDAAREMGRRGRRAFEERFNWPANAQPLVEFLREMLDEQGDPPPAADGTRDGSCAG